jgi:hypothetical protein
MKIIKTIPMRIVTLINISNCPMRKSIERIKFLKFSKYFDPKINLLGQYLPQ